MSDQYGQRFKVIDIMKGGEDGWDIEVVAASDYDRLTAENKHLTRGIRDALAIVDQANRGQTHYEGCDQVHWLCGIGKVLQDALAGTAEPDSTSSVKTAAHPLDAIKRLKAEPLFADGVDEGLHEAGITKLRDAYVLGRSHAFDEIELTLVTAAPGVGTDTRTDLDALDDDDLEAHLSDR